MVEVTIHPEAEAEYERALGWYHDRSPRSADRFEAAVGKAIETIRSHPTMFPHCDDRHRFVLLRRYPYCLIYRVDGAAVRVISDAHAKRRTRYWSDRA